MAIISSALFVSLLGAGVEIITPTDNNDRDTNATRTILAENAASPVADAIAQIIQIFVQHDIIFPHV